VKMAKGGEKAKRSATADVHTLEATINLHKRIFGVGFKSRAPRAVKECKAFAQKLMGTKDCRVDQTLNKHLWSQGIRNVPFRVRVRLERKRNEDEDAAEKLYTLIKIVPGIKSFKGLETQVVEADSSPNHCF
jgi:large subunit ribosomal protein L31e